jgi:hypothetical protein
MDNYSFKKLVLNKIKYDMNSLNVARTIGEKGYHDRYKSNPFYITLELARTVMVHIL